MKKVVVILLMMTILIPTGIARNLLAEGNTFTKFGTYKIETADKPFILKGKEFKAYLITYENAGFSVQIIPLKTRDGLRLLVLSDVLSVQYDSHHPCFGVDKIDELYSGDGLKTSESALNKYEYFHQKVLTSWEVTELEKIKLVAAYYPALLNNADNLVTSK